MPELCGIITSEGLSPEQYAGWISMRNALSQSRKSKTVSVKKSWAAQSIITHHDHDFGMLHHEKDSPYVYGFNGTGQ